VDRRHQPAVERYWAVARRNRVAGKVQLVGSASGWGQGLAGGQQALDLQQQVLGVGVQVAGLKHPKVVREYWVLGVRHQVALQMLGTRDQGAVQRDRVLGRGAQGVGRQMVSSADRVPFGGGHMTDQLRHQTFERSYGGTHRGVYRCV